MLRIPRRGKGPLLVLLFATLIGSSGCVTGSQPEEEGNEMEVSQNAELANESADAGNLAEESGDELDSNLTEQANLANDQGTAPKSDAELAAPASEPIPAELPQTSMDRGYVAGKAGTGMEQGLPEEGSKMAYIVLKGDTLSKIAKRIFSNKERWRELATASSVKNPHWIYPGDVIFYQLDSTTLAFAKTYEAMQRAETTVRHGENLSEVSKRVYGDKDQWKFLWRHNDQITDPNHLALGSVVYYVSPQALTTLANTDYTTVKMPTEISHSKRVYKHPHKRLRV